MIPKPPVWSRKQPGRTAFPPQTGYWAGLLRHAFGEYYRRGYKGVALGVDAENLTGALRLYKKAGMYVHRQFDLYEKELRPGREVSVQGLAE